VQKNKFKWISYTIAKPWINNDNRLFQLEAAFFRVKNLTAKLARFLRNVRKGFAFFAVKYIFDCYLYQDEILHKKASILLNFGKVFAVTLHK